MGPPMITNLSDSPRLVQQGMIALTAALVAASVAHAAVSDGAPPLRQCIDPSSTSSWTAYDDHTILVRSIGRSFLVRTGACPRLAAPLTHITVAPSGGLICGPHDVRLYVSDSSDSIPLACNAESITALTQDEVTALRTRQH